MLKKYICGFAALFTAAVISAGGFPAGTEIKQGGQFRFGGLDFFIVHFNPNWAKVVQKKSTIKPEQGYPVERDGKFQLKASYKCGFKLDETITATVPGSISYSSRLTSSNAIPTNDLSLCTTLSAESFAGATLTFDGKDVSLPEKYDEKVSNHLFFGSSVKEIVLPVAKGRLTVSGDFQVLLQDNRKYNSDTFSIRIQFDKQPSAKSVKDARLSLNFTFAPYRSFPLNIASQCNMGLIDEVAGDGKGGWTDEGPRKDMRQLKPGNYNFCGIKFAIIDPTSNQGRACIVLGDPRKNNFPATVAISPKNMRGSSLYLLHAIDRIPDGQQHVGTVNVTYSDGSKSNLKVVSGKDTGYWIRPESLPNGLVAWQKKHNRNDIGLYLSKFKIESKPVKSIALNSTGKCIWMVPAITISPDDIPLPRKIVRPFTIVEDAQWKPFKYDHDIIPGSIMDFSSLLDAPAGKYGMVTIKDGQFVFRNAPQKRIKFYGANLCFMAQFMDKKLCEKLADRLARMGYNSVRFHHFDDILTRSDKKGGVILIPEKLDQMDYLFYCLKKRGIYLTIDLYTIRRLAKGDIAEFPDMAISASQFKGLAFISDEVMNNWKEFSRKLLNHVNPYTGIAWKNDPALIGIGLINEDTVFSVANRTPEVTEIYDRKFKSWLKNKNITPASAIEKSALKKRFLIEVYNRAYQKMKGYMQELGVKIPLSDQNFWSNVPLCLMRQQYDYVDNHNYWDHPNFPVNSWRLPVAIGNKSAVARFAQVPLEVAPTRIFGKPMMLTEFNYSSPNQYRAESGLLMGAYSALQDWDGLYRFAYSHRGIGKPFPHYLFDVFTCPVSVIAEKMGVLCFLRGDVKRAKACFPTLVSENYLNTGELPEHYPNSVWRLGLLGQVGSVVVPAAETSVPLPKGSIAVDGMEANLKKIKWNVPYFQAWPRDNVIADMLKARVVSRKNANLKKGFFRSLTGELTLNQQKGTFKVVTACSEGAVLPAGKSMLGNVLAISNNTAFGVFFASAMDGKTLAESKRVLLMHMTDVQNTGAKFSSSGMTMWLELGKLPHLLRKGEAKISLRGDFKSHKLFAVNLAGKRLAEIPFVKTATGISFSVDTHRLKNGVVAYELVSSK